MVIGVIHLDFANVYLLVLLASLLKMIPLVNVSYAANLEHMVKINGATLTLKTVQVIHSPTIKIIYVTLAMKLWALSEILYLKDV